MVKAYEQVEIFHIQPGQLRQLGLPMYSDILFSQPHYDLLAKVFGGRDYEISAETASRRVGRTRQPPHWLPPLGPHLDAFIHAPRFTVNFWVPFQECGVDAPSLGVVEAPFADIVSFTGYENGAELWADPAPVGPIHPFSAGDAGDVPLSRSGGDRRDARAVWRPHPHARASRRATR